MCFKLYDPSPAAGSAFEIQKCFVVSTALPPQQRAWGMIVTA
jgi:hypothetical protein